MSGTKQTTPNRPAGPKPEGKAPQGPGFEILESRRAPMQIFIMRHGIAARRASPPTGNDATRSLTPKGKKRVQQIAAGLKKLGCKPDWIITSPLARAAETAEIVATGLLDKAPVDLCAALRPGGAPDELLSFLARHRERKRVLLVGHEPDLSELAARLIAAGSQAKLAFKKGGCCLIRCDGPPRFRGQLVWWLTPRLLRAIR